MIDSGKFHGKHISSLEGARPLIRIVVADDHAVVREGLVRILSQEWPGATFGEASNAVETLRLLEEQSWDMIILDLVMPGAQGLGLLSETKKARPELPVLVLTVHPEEQYAARTFKAGGSGYLTKDCTCQELISAVRKVLGGGHYVSAALAEKLASGLSGDASTPRHELLSQREYQVLCGIATGKTVSEIAREMSLSVKTVSSYRARLLEKMGMRTNAELTRYAIVGGLV